MPQPQADQSNPQTNPLVHAFFHAPSSTFSYVLVDPLSRHAVVIDPVFDGDGGTGAHAADEPLAFIRSNGLKVDWILETHIHADHLTGASYLAERLPGARIACSGAVAGLACHSAEGCHHGAGADRYLSDGECIGFGQLKGRPMATPGHTPTCMTYVFGNCAFVGDTLFMPDIGTARCDFPGGSARTLYASIQKILALPDATRLFMCHDYPPADRDRCYQTTVAAERQHNIHTGIDVGGEETFVELRTRRDATLSPPKMMRKALPYNVGVLQQDELRTAATLPRARAHSMGSNITAH